MADVVWSLLLALPGSRRDQVEEMVAMARLWADHLRGPGAHEGPIVLLTNLEAVSFDGVSVVRVESRARARREVFRDRPRLAIDHLRPGPEDRCMQLDTDSLARHPIAPLFREIEPGEMRVAPSMLPLAHPQQAGLLLPRWKRAWYGRVRGWNARLGVSASLTACRGKDWETFMGSWAAAIERHARRSDPSGRPGDQGYLNWLYAVEELPMRRYGGSEIHHLRIPDSAPRTQIEQARILHFPVPEKLRRMREWSRL